MNQNIDGVLYLRIIDPYKVRNTVKSCSHRAKANVKRKSSLMLPFVVDLFTARKRSLRRLCFHMCFSVHGWEGDGGLQPGGVGQTYPFPIGYYGIRSTSGLYASYWNAFFFLIV